jgi:uncharacterized membrane protein (UPF0127 family)
MTEIVICNTTRGGGIVGSKIQLAESFMEKLIGLMGSKSMVQGAGMLLLNCSSIHTFWMRMPIDVLYLDSLLSVIAIDKSLKPSRIGSIRFSTKNVLELPAGTADQIGVEIGDRLFVRPAGA